MKDYFGQPLEVGNQIAFMQVGYRNLTTGIITKITAKKVFILFNDRYTHFSEAIQEGNQVVKKPS